MSLISGARATFGLFATGSHTSSGVTGDVQIGAPNTAVRLPDADCAYQIRAIFAASGETFLLDMAAGATSGSTAWVSGYPEIETGTASGTITTAGNATAIVTAAGMTGSPRTITFAVTLGDTAAVWAAKARVALVADASVSAKFNVSGTGAAIILTKKPVATYNAPGGVVEIFGATDSTLNIALGDATSAGITEAASSANTTTGAATTGCKIYDGDGKDFEGNPLPGNFSIFYGFLLQTEGDTMVFDDTAGNSFNIAAGEILLRAGEAGIASTPTFTVTASGHAALTVTVIYRT